MGIGDWGLGIGDWGLGIGPNPQSPIPNPQSPFFRFHYLKYIKYFFQLIIIIFKNNFNFIFVRILFSFLEIIKKIFFIIFGHCQVICPSVLRTVPGRKVRDSFKVAFFYLKKMADNLNNNQIDIYLNHIPQNQDNQTDIRLRQERREVSFKIDQNFCNLH